MSYFTGKVIWITGASSGIGEALAVMLANRGAKLILSSRNEKELQRVQQSSKLGNENCLILLLDLSNTSEVAALSEKAISKFGKIDILINNGGISQRAFATETALEVDRRIMEVNYFGTVALTKAVLPYMLKAGAGQIIVISSISGKFGFFLRSAYSASKHALHGFFDTLRMELYAKNIKVLLVCPGKIATSISVNAVLGNGEQNKVMDQAQEKGMPATECASKILSAIEKGKEEVYVGGFRERFALWLKRFSPRLFSIMIRNQKVE